MPCCSTVNNLSTYLSNLTIYPLRSPPTTKTKLILPLRHEDEGVLGIIALRKFARFTFSIRDQARLIQNRQVHVLLCHLGTFVRVVSGFTADAADPLRALEPFVPCFLANAAGNFTTFFSRWSCTTSQILRLLLEPCSFPILLAFCSSSPAFPSSRTRGNESGVGIS